VAGTCISTGSSCKITLAMWWMGRISYPPQGRRQEEQCLGEFGIEEEAAPLEKPWLGRWEASRAKQDTVERCQEKVNGEGER